MQEKSKNSICGNIHAYFERQNYFFGKLMTKRDFQDEQSYFNEKRWILNRLGIGWGVLCGLKVKMSNESSSKVIVEPGFALDPYGHEILVCEEFLYDLKEEVNKLHSVEELEKNKHKIFTCYLSICYKECFAEPTRIPVESCCSTDTQCIHNRIRECFEIKISDDKPELIGPCDSSVIDEYGCKIDCFRFLEDPCKKLIECCPDRPQCMCVPLARVDYVLIEDKCNGFIPEIVKVANCDGYRKLAFSNEHLYKLIYCLKNELWKAHWAKYDRKRYVPLLAQTIKGIEYKNGKITTIKEGMGIQPTRITTDGEYIWITDQQSNEIIRIDRNSDPAIKFNKIVFDDKDDTSWGIAFDGHFMWVSHPDSIPGRLSRINVCNPGMNTIQAVKLEAVNPREVLFDGRYIWVAHGIQGDKREKQLTNQDEKKCGIFTLSQVDPIANTLLKTHEILLNNDYHLASSDISMTYDGEYMWIALQVKTAQEGQNNPKGIIIRVHATNLDAELCKGIPEVVLIEDIAFDGTHVWITHEDGATKIDIESNKNIDSLSVKGGRVDQTAIVFDGSNIWTAEKISTEARLYKLDIHSVEALAGLEYYKIQSKINHVVSKMCFDGSFLWVAAYNKKSSRSSDTKTKGIVHRLLP
jgi:hypothetical protein